MDFEIRNDRTIEEVKEIFKKPLIDLVFQAATIHRACHKHREVQIATLLSIKTGGCPEDCSYCPQAARYNTDVKVQALLPVEEVVATAKKAKASGATRFCMGAAWREVRDNRDFDRVLEMVEEVDKLGLEVCTTLGMLTEDQAKRLKKAGVHAYNHNVDTSEDYYSNIISSRKFDDRLDTLKHIRKANMTVCSGGIIGMGESEDDRIKMLHLLSSLDKHPESVPINKLVRIKGTPLENQAAVPAEDMVRMVATARILMPKSFVRLSAGRTEMSRAEQFLCFFAGANSIFSGDVLLTTPNPDFSNDLDMLKAFGLLAKEPEDVKA
jgi:biotin synthase